MRGHCRHDGGVSGRREEREPRAGGGGGTSCDDVREDLRCSGGKARSSGSSRGRDGGCGGSGGDVGCGGGALRRSGRASPSFNCSRRRVRGKHDDRGGGSGDSGGGGRHSGYRCGGYHNYLRPSSATGGSNGGRRGYGGIPAVLTTDRHHPAKGGLGKWKGEGKRVGGRWWDGNGWRGGGRGRGGVRMVCPQ